MVVGTIRLPWCSFPRGVQHGVGGEEWRLFFGFPKAVEPGGSLFSLFSPHAPHAEIILRGMIGPFPNNVSWILAKSTPMD
jgi:hypothetical protein